MLKDLMILKFSLYGFLKNLRFFEPFFLLFLLDKGLNYTQIGMLFAFREVCINVLEIPSGVIADLYGKKKSMIISFLAYILSFFLFSFVKDFTLLIPAMFMFAIGEAFRTGTHKAMIFDYLRVNEKLDQKTRVYGCTRSWSQIGSALSVLIGAILMFFAQSYDYIFIFSAIPYFLAIINFFTYPDWLDKADQKSSLSIKEAFHHLKNSISKSFKNSSLRNLIIQSTIYEGQFRAVKDYLQIMIKAQVLLLPVYFGITSHQQTAIMIGLIYFVLYLLSSSASKASHKVLDFFKTTNKAIHAILVFTTLLLVVSALAYKFQLYAISIFTFVLLFAIENIMRPITTAAYDDFADSHEQATMLSIESQAHSIGIAIMAPITGYLTDSFGAHAAFLFCAIVVGGWAMISRKISV